MRNTHRRLAQYIVDFILIMIGINVFAQLAR